jgi:hypothetical protein
MKTLITAALGAVLLTAVASPSQAQRIVVWRTVTGIAQPGNVVGGITGAGQPWSAREGEIFVELDSGVVFFEVRGLVLAGGNSIGTRGSVSLVSGTLVCGPGSPHPVIVRTPFVELDAQGNASGSGTFGPTAGCSPTDVAFLFRVQNGNWIANGSVRVP